MAEREEGGPLNIDTTLLLSLSLCLADYTNPGIESLPSVSSSLAFHLSTHAQMYQSLLQQKQLSAADDYQSDAHSVRHSFIHPLTKTYKTVTKP
jgi:hypothetical protein